MKCRLRAASLGYAGLRFRPAPLGDERACGAAAPLYEGGSVRRFGRQRGVLRRNRREGRQSNSHWFARQRIGGRDVAGILRTDPPRTRSLTSRIYRWDSSIGIKIEPVRLPDRASYGHGFGTLRSSLAPLAFLPCISRYGLFLIPGFVEVLASQRPVTLMPGAHYSALLTGYALAGFVDGASRLAARRQAPRSTGYRGNGSCRCDRDLRQPDGVLVLSLSAAGGARRFARRYSAAPPADGRRRRRRRNLRAPQAWIRRHPSISPGSNGLFTTRRTIPNAGIKAMSPRCAARSSAAITW